MGNRSIRPARRVSLRLLLVGSTIAALAVAVAPAQARTIFLRPPTVTTVGDFPVDAAAADFDSDGDLDLAVANLSSDTISVLGYAGGTYFTLATLPLSHTPQTVAAGDLNGDLHADVVVGTGSGHLVVLSGDGTGTFGPPDVVSAVAGGGIHTVETGDFDGDGTVDLALVNGGASGGLVYAFHNTGTGVNFDVQSFPVGLSPLDVVVADLDGDSDQDLAVPGYAGDISVLINQAGTFDAPVSHPAAETSRQVAAGDFDLDGDNDLVVTVDSAGRLDILFNAGDGTFGSPQPVPLEGMGTSDIVVADFDADGDPDLAVSNVNFTRVTVLVNDGAGSFNLEHQAAGFASVGLVAGDVDIDGDPDLAVVNHDADSVAYLRNDTSDPRADLRLSTPTHTPAVEDAPVTFTMELINAGPFAAPSVVLTDELPPGVLFGGVDHPNCTGDAGTMTCTFEELPVGQLETIRVQVIPMLPGSLVHTATVSSAFTDPVPGDNTSTQTVPVGPAVFEFQALDPVPGPIEDAIVADFNGDGIPDVAGPAPDEIVVLFGDGDGGLSAGVSVPVPAFMLRPLGFDADGDNDVDLVVGGAEIGSLGLFRNDGTGAFSPFAPASPLLDAGEVELAADFDRDGDVDVIGRVNEDLGVFLNDGTGSFAAPTAFLSSSHEVRAGDMDGDLDADLVIADAEIQVVRVLFNDGSGAFTAGTPVPGLGGAVEPFTLGDFDGDADLDAVAIDEFNTFYVLLNDGGGTLSLSSLGPAVTSDSVTAGDLDLDGDADLVVSDETGTSLLTNHGDATFDLGGLTVPSDDPAVADMDGDGDPDIVSASPPDGVVVIRNLRPSAPAEDSVADTLEAGDTLSTPGTVDAGNPIGTSVTTPTGGVVAIEESGPTTEPTSGSFRYLDREARIEAPDADSPDDPLVIVFRLHNSIAPGEDETTLHVFHDGVRIEDCTGDAGVAAPDPCLTRGREGTGADVVYVFTVFTTHNGAYNIAENNAAPIAHGDAFQATQNQALTVAAPGLLGNDTDLDGNPLTAQPVSAPNHGTVVVQRDGSFTYTPDSGYHGPDSFTYRADDGSAESAAATVTIDVAEDLRTDILFSTSSRARFGGHPVADEDIVRYSVAENAFDVVFDGSDVRLAGLAIDAMAVLDNGDLVLSFGTAARIPGAGLVDDSDLVRFAPSRLGSDTGGTFSLYLDGSDIGLTDSGEDIDAVAVDGPDVYLSTTGSFQAAGNVSGDNEDVFVCRSLSATSGCGALESVLDGGVIGLGGRDENIDALAFSPGGSATLLSADGKYSAGSVAGQSGDVFACWAPLAGCDATSDANVVFTGAQLGIGKGNLTAIETSIAPIELSLP